MKAGTWHVVSGIRWHFAVALVRITEASGGGSIGSIVKGNSASNTACVADGVVCVVVLPEHCFVLLAFVGRRARTTGAISDKASETYKNEIICFSIT